MNRDVFGKPLEKKTISIHIFHDERRFEKDWLYHGLVIIPDDFINYVFDRLQICRSISNYYRELHFCEITSEQYSNKIKLAREWINFFLNEFYKLGYFYFFGVFLRNIRHDFFGVKEDRRSQIQYRIYNRFFDISLFSALRFYFKDYDKVIVSNIFSHASDRPEEDPFPQHSIYKITKRNIENISIKTLKIIQINSDHNEEKRFPKESHFVQFADNILGVTAQVFDCSSKKECFIELGNMMLPFIQKITENPYNKNSDYYKKYIVSFFPKTSLSPRQIYLAHGKNMFFYKRELKLQTRNQLKLQF